MVGDHDTIVYIFSPNCPWCARNLKQIQELEVKRKGSNRFLGISTTADQLPAYVAKHGLSFPVFVAESDAALAAMEFFGTPQTLLVRRDGLVTHNWRGAYTGAVKSGIEQTFSIRLPELPLH
jgi:peroxiredoxin